MPIPSAAPSSRARTTPDIRPTAPADPPSAASRAAASARAVRRAARGRSTALAAGVDISDAPLPQAGSAAASELREFAMLGGGSASSGPGVDGSPRQLARFFDWRHLERQMMAGARAGAPAALPWTRIGPRLLRRLDSRLLHFHVGEVAGRTPRRSRSAQSGSACSARAKMRPSASRSAPAIGAMSPATKVEGARRPVIHS